MTQDKFTPGCSKNYSVLKVYFQRVQTADTKVKSII